MSPAKKPAKRSTGSSTKSAGASRTPKTAARKTSAKSTAKAAPKKAVAKKTTTKKTTAKKTVAKKAPAKKTPAKKTTAKKAPAKKASAKKASAKKTPAKKTPAKKTPAKKTTAKKTVAKKAPARKTVAKKTTAPKSAPAAPSKKPAAKAPARPQPKRPPASRPARPANFDKKQLAAIREHLVEEKAELFRQQNELDAEGTQGESLAEAGLDDDFADAGTATFDRERDLSIRNNITDLIDQITRAVARIDEGSYGTCERCGRPIDAARLKALPHALLCLDCKRREERGR